MKDDGENTTHPDDNPYASPTQDNPSLESPGLAWQNGGAVTASLTYTSDYVIESLARYRAQLGTPAVQLILRIIAVVSFAFFAFYQISQRHFALGILIALFTVSLIVRQRVNDWRTRRAFGASPHANEELTIRLSDTDFHVWSAMQDVRLEWRLFTKVVDFDDGVLIFQGPSVFHWIPFSALDAGNDLNDIASLLRAKITQHDKR